MKQKKNRLFYYFAIAFLALTAGLGIVSFVLLSSRADTSGTTTAVTNVAPTVDTITLKPGTVALACAGAATTTVTLTENTTTDYCIEATFTDNNGCDDVASATAALYLTTGGSGCVADDLNCYQIANVNCAISSCTAGGADLTGVVQCDVAPQYYATPGTGTWSAFVELTDGTAATGNSTQAITVSQLLALNVAATINYGTLALGGLTGGADTAAGVPATVTNTGNVVLNYTVSGANMSCPTSGNTIAVGQQKYSLTDNYSYSGAGTALTTLATSVNPAIAATTNGVASTGDIFWKIQLPATGVRGTCTGTNTFTAQ